jgi:hypothetical protein
MWKDDGGWMRDVFGGLRFRDILLNYAETVNQLAASCFQTDRNFHLHSSLFPQKIIKNARRSRAFFIIFSF